MAIHSEEGPVVLTIMEEPIVLNKTTLKNIIGRAYRSLETLQTVVTEIESIMNDRPLMRVSTNLDDPEPSIPAHLLYGRRITSLLYSDDISMKETNRVSSGHRNITKRMKIQAHLIDGFWRRWTTEYMTALREHHRKTGSNYQSIRVGDIFQVHDGCPRTSWKLAVIKELVSGKDGLTQAAKICTSKELYITRNIVKLYIMLNDNRSE